MTCIRRIKGKTAVAQRFKGADTLGGKLIPGGTTALILMEAAHKNPALWPKVCPEALVLNILQLTYLMQMLILLELNLNRF